MKRSDAQLKICEALESEQSGFPYGSFSGFHLSEAALKACEELGMLPPLKEHKEFGISGTLDNEGRIHFEFKWEPEDE